MWLYNVWTSGGSYFATMKFVDKKPSDARKAHAVIYVRVSTMKQGRPELGHVSIDVQEKACRQYAILHNITVVGVFAECVSAREMENQKRLVAAYRAMKMGDTLLTYSVNRFTRDMCCGVALLKALQKNNCMFKSVSDGYDYSTFQNRNVVHIALSQAEYQSEEISMRVRASIAYKRARGECIGTPAYPYIAVRKTIQLPDGKLDTRRDRVLDPHAIEVLKKIHHMDIAFDHSVILADLVARGETYNGKPWTLARIDTALERYESLISMRLV